MTWINNNSEILLTYIFFLLNVNSKELFRKFRKPLQILLLMICFGVLIDVLEPDQIGASFQYSTLIIKIKIITWLLLSINVINMLELK